MAEPASVHGSCLGGAVSFRITGPIHNARYCHCANCRKFSGTASAAWGLVRAAQLEIVAPETSVTKFDSGGGLRDVASKGLFRVDDNKHVI
jgi:hypothetical protein